MLCLPCTAKQSFKKAFQLPVQEYVVKPNTTQSCLTVVDNATQQQSIAKQKINLKHQRFCYSVFVKSSTVVQPHHVTIDASFSRNTVPIYILHEQYII